MKATKKICKEPKGQGRYPSAPRWAPFSVMYTTVLVADAIFYYIQRHLGN